MSKWLKKYGSKKLYQTTSATTSPPVGGNHREPFVPPSPTQTLGPATPAFTSPSTAYPSRMIPDTYNTMFTTTNTLDAGPIKPQVEVVSTSSLLVAVVAISVVAAVTLVLVTCIRRAYPQRQGRNGAANITMSRSSSTMNRRLFNRDEEEAYVSLSSLPLFGQYSLGSRGHTSIRDHAAPATHSLLNAKEEFAPSPQPHALAGVVASPIVATPPLQPPPPPPPPIPCTSSRKPNQEERLFEELLRVTAKRKRNIDEYGSHAEVAPTKEVNEVMEPTPIPPPGVPAPRGNHSNALTAPERTDDQDRCQGNVNLPTGKLPARCEILSKMASHELLDQMASRRIAVSGNSDDENPDSDDWPLDESDK